MTRAATLGTLATVVGFLAFVEFTSGVLQGYYTPMLTDIARHLGIHDADVNWLEGAQLMLSALVVPAFAKLGDMVGHKRMLLISTFIKGAAAFVLPFTDSFGIFLAAWALMGFYVVWLPLEIALTWSRSRRAGRHPRHQPRHGLRSGPAPCRREPLPGGGASPRRLLGAGLGRRQHR